tara:strand:+ start:804 stop:926 length:123 start_codon:yes stop_codon:yes gene_type:complete
MQVKNYEYTNEIYLLVANEDKKQLVDLLGSSHKIKSNYQA